MSFADRCRQLEDDKIFREVISAVEQSCYHTIAKSEPADTHIREEQYQLLRAIKAIRGILRSTTDADRIQKSNNLTTR